MAVHTRSHLPLSDQASRVRRVLTADALAFLADLKR